MIHKHGGLGMNFVEFVGYSVADEITKLDKLKSVGSIAAQEYSQLRTRLLQ